MTHNKDHDHAVGALEALNSIRDSRAQALANMNYWPWWYDLGYGAACALLVAGQGFNPFVGIACSLSAMAILLVIVRRWKAETGVWVNGYSPKRARWVAYGLVALLLGLLGASVWFGRIQDLIWVPLVSGAVAAVLAVVGMRVWMHQYRKDVKDLT